MKIKNKIFLQEWMFLVLIWILFMNLAGLFYLGMQDYICIGEWEVYANSWFAYFENTLFGFVFGTLFAMINHISNFPMLRKYNFGKIILIKSFFYIIAFVITVFISVSLYYAIGAFEGKTLDDIIDFIQPSSLVVWVCFMFILIVFTNFLLQINKKFGQGALLKMLMGEYHKPKDEIRIFMFLDLKGSTSIAEKLGHNLYSRMIQDCFHELTDVVISHKAEIYQYVGDEVVLTWKVKEGLENLNCIQFYYSFREKLRSREAHFKKRYNLLPQFKAGMEMGTVTVAEVGDIKREIAYHGDVLNTAARVQEKCNEYNQWILISENLAAAIRESTGVEYQLIDDVNLRGKVNGVKIYAVNENVRHEKVQV
ncbi:MAG: adenylate/guanylate cyclase domain-containing protein [Thalassobius sp.]|nr:adenylate/guanylate cyclase domain-containing protein [Thalassovita sp.]